MRRSALPLLSLFACGDDLARSPLTITFEATPAVLSSEARSTFIFKVDGAVSRLTCTLDHGPAIDCQSPFTVPALDEDEHRFVVTATGEALQASHATHQWRVDLTVPETQLLLAPPALFTEETSTVMFAGAGDVARHPTASSASTRSGRRPTATSG